VPGVQPAPEPALAYVQGPVPVTIDNWTLSVPKFSFAPFSVQFRATRNVGSAMLTFDIVGTLGDFNSRGALHVRHQRVASSSMGATGLNAHLTVKWSLSAPVSNAAIGFLPPFDLVLPLFRWPLLVGDFPMYLSVEARLHVALDLPSTQVLGGHADIGISGSQGLSFHEGGARGVGLLQELRHAHPRISGLPFVLPKLDLGVTFPYLEIGDDLNNPLAGALVWTGFTLDTETGSGADPNLCLRADARVHADAGLTFWLFGHTVRLSRPFYQRDLGSASWPSNLPCSAP
jgi:hypothetical protein